MKVSLGINLELCLYVIGEVFWCLFSLPEKLKLYGFPNFPITFCENLLPSGIRYTDRKNSNEVQKRRAPIPYLLEGMISNSAANNHDQFILSKQSTGNFSVFSEFLKSFRRHRLKSYTHERMRMDITFCAKTIAQLINAGNFHYQVHPFLTLSTRLNKFKAYMFFMILGIRRACERPSFCHHNT